MADAPWKLGLCVAAWVHTVSVHSAPSNDVFAQLPPLQEVASTDAAPMAVRGFVLILPLSRRNQHIPWPQLIELKLQDGRALVGRPAKLLSARIDPHGWTSPPVTTCATNADGDQDIVLLVPLPDDADGSLMLGEQVLAPRWMTPLAPTESVTQSDAFIGELDRPDANAPSEYFRSWLLAHRLRLTPPAPIGDELNVMYARAVAGLWSAAIAHLQENDAAAASRVCIDLTGRAHGFVGQQERSMAAWETNADELSILLRSLLTPSAPGLVLSAAASHWVDHRSALTIWVHEERGDSVVIGIANPRANAFPLSFRWPDTQQAILDCEIAPESFQYFDIPRIALRAGDSVQVDEALSVALQEHGLAALLPPADLVGENQTRDAVESQARAQSTLLVDDGIQRIAIPVGLGRIAVRPPGLGLGRFRPAATLSQVRSGMLQSPPSNWSTSAGIRRRPTGWEIIVECFAPQDAAPTRDAVTVRVTAATDHTVVIHSDGSVDAEDAVVRSGAAMHRSSDRWRARLPLPDSWVFDANGRVGKLAIAIDRTIDGSDANAPPLFARRQYAGLSPVWFTPTATRIPLDLSSWSLSSVTLAP
ncbi:MAG: hypothetical protein EXS15_06960 [Phycisphaerales bacterium]|nr:hypothetical protein [Phycisphaerales bacterium]